MGWFPRFARWEHTVRFRVGLTYVISGVPMKRDRPLKAPGQRLKEKGVVFTIEPRVAGKIVIAIFSDTCGNLIQVYQLAT